MHYHRDSVTRPSFAENTVGAPRKRIRTFAVGKREQVIWKKMVRVLPVSSCRHGEAIVEHAIATPGDNGNHSVEYLAAI